MAPKSKHFSSSIAAIGSILVATALVPGFVAAPAKGADSARAAAAPAIQQFLRIWIPRSPQPLADGSLLIIDRAAGVPQLFRIVPRGRGPDALDPRTATRVQLTDYPDGLSSFSVSPDGRWVVLMHAPGGNENWQLTLLDLAGRVPVTSPLFSNPAVQASVNAWFRDGSGLIYSANDASSEDFHLYRWDFASRRAVPILQRPGSWRARDVSDDGTRVLLNQSVSASDVRCFELDLGSGELTDLTIRPGQGTAASRIVGYTADERSVIVQSDHRGGRGRMYVRDLSTGAIREPVEELGKFDLDGIEVSPARDRLAAVTNEGGQGVLHVYTLPGFRPLPPPTEEQGMIAGFGFRGRELVWSLSNARRPGVAFATTYPADAAAAPTTRQLTWTDDQGIDFAAFRLPELVRFEAFDGLEIPAFLYLPAGHRPGTPVPFVITYHGGPEAQHRPDFGVVTQYLVSRGFGVLRPNVRGSTGYGREYQMLDDYRLRWNSVRDGVDAAEWLVRKGYAVPGRIATHGSSYGGYMAVACLVEDAERVERGERAQPLFGACVDVVGIVNVRTFLEKTSDYRRKRREVEYGPLTNPAFLDSISSLRRAEKIRVPVFIAHGFNDPRVPVHEAMQLATILKEQGNHPRLFIAPDEGHGFAKLDNQIYFYERMMQFLEETIGRGAGPPLAN